MKYLRLKFFMKAIPVFLIMNGEVLANKFTGECIDIPEHNYIANQNGHEPFVRNQFETSIWVMPVNQVQSVDFDLTLVNLINKGAQRGEPYANCITTPLFDGHGWAKHQCTNQYGARMSGDVSLEGAILGSFKNIPSRNELPFATISQRKIHYFACKDDRFVSYSIGILEVSNQTLQDKIYFSTSVWQPHESSYTKKNPSASDYQF